MPPTPNYQHLKRFYKNVTVVPHPMSDDLPKLEKDEPVSEQQSFKRGARATRGHAAAFEEGRLVMAGIAFTVCGGETFGCARFCDDRSGGRYNDR